MSGVHRTGLTELHSGIGPNGESPKASIVFIHGLGGHPKNTWSAKYASQPGVPEERRASDSSTSSMRGNASANAPTYSGGERKNSMFTKFMPKRSKPGGADRNMSVSSEGGVSPREVNTDPFATLATSSEPEPLSSPALSPPVVPASNPFSRTTSIATTTAGFPAGLPDNIKKIFWPRDLLPADFPYARIYTFGYDADLVNFGGSGKSEVKVSQHAHELFVTLNRELEENVPIILCAHSLGGVLVKRALYESSTTHNPFQQKLCNQTKAVMFFGTPHRGSSTASWGKIGTNIAAMAQLDSRQHLVKQLKLDSELLDIFHGDFMRLIQEGKFWVHTFQEGLAMNNFIGKVVEDYSSKLDETSPMQTTEVINGNHRSMIRFSSPQDPGYRKVVSALRQYMLMLDEKHDQERKSIASVYSANEAPTYFSVPYERNNDFVGRSDCIDEINKVFSGPKHTPFLALHGLGGIGKTQVAIELAYQWRQFFPLYSIFWVHATSVERFDEGLQEILDKLEIPHSADTNIRTVVEGWLSDENNGQWLFVIDNVDDKNVLDQNNGKGTFKMLSCIPKVAHGHVLFTSRYKNVALDLTKDTVRIDQMSQPEAFDLLKVSLRECYNEEEKTEAEKLLDELSCIPLAITQAAAYIRENEDTIANYLTLYQESEENRYELLEQEIADLGITSDADTPKMVLNTFRLSFERLKTDGAAGPLATELLSLMSFLDRQHIPRTLLQTMSGANNLKLNNALGRLKAYALVTENAATVKEYSMHRLVQLSMRKLLESEEKTRKFRDQVLKTMSAEFPNGSFATWGKCRSLIVHADAILDLSTTSEDRSSRVKLLANCANFQNGRGQYIPAVKKYKEVVELREEMLGADHVDTLRARDQLAWTLRNQAEKKEALEWAKKTLAKKEELFGKNSAEALATSHIVGTLLGDEGQHRESSAIHRANLDARIELLGAEHLDTLRSASYLSLELWQLGKFAEAEDLARETLASRTKALNEDHPETLEIAETLGFILEIQGKYAEAKELKEGMLAIRKEKYGEDHPDTADSHHDMGWILHQMGNYEDAEPHYALSLKAKKKLLGDAHWKTLTTMCNYPVFYCDKGEYDKAEERSKTLISAFKQIQGPQHPQTLDATGGLAVILRHQGKLAEAAAAARTSIDGRNIVLGPDHPWTLPPVSHWGYVLTLQGELQKGEEVIREALKKLEEHMGPVSSNVLTSLVFLSKNLLLQATGPEDPRLDESEKLARRALESRKKLLGELPPGSGIQHPYTYKTMHHLARVLFAKGQYEDAAKLSREALKMVITLGPEHPDVSRADEDLRNMEVKLEEKEGYVETQVIDI